jgi:hypothetical protein
MIDKKYYSIKNKSMILMDLKACNEKRFDEK